jgi:hypothetical protein
VVLEGTRRDYLLPEPLSTTRAATSSSHILRRVFEVEEGLFVLVKREREMGWSEQEDDGCRRQRVFQSGKRQAASASAFAIDAMFMGMME